MQIHKYRPIEVDFDHTNVDWGTVLFSFWDFKTNWQNFNFSSSNEQAHRRNNNKPNRHKNRKYKFMKIYYWGFICSFCGFLWWILFCFFWFVVLFAFACTALYFKIYTILTLYSPLNPSPVNPRYNFRNNRLDTSLILCPARSQANAHHDNNVWQEQQQSTQPALLWRLEIR